VLCSPRSRGNVASVRRQPRKCWKCARFEDTKEKLCPLFYHFFVNALTSAEVTEQVPINTNINKFDCLFNNQYKRVRSRGPVELMSFSEIKETLVPVAACQYSQAE